MTRVGRATPAIDELVEKVAAVPGVVAIALVVPAEHAGCVGMLASAILCAVHSRLAARRQWVLTKNAWCSERDCSVPRS